MPYAQASDDVECYQSLETSALPLNSLCRRLCDHSTSLSLGLGIDWSLVQLDTLHFMYIECPRSASLILFQSPSMFTLQ